MKLLKITQDLTLNMDQVTSLEVVGLQYGREDAVLVVNFATTGSRNEYQNLYFGTWDDCRRLKCAIEVHCIQLEIPVGIEL